MIEQLVLLFILVGSTIGAVLLVLWLQARKAGRISLALIRLNEQYNFDTPLFLRNAWPLLAQAGLRGMEWRLDWFGLPVNGEAGHCTGDSLHKEIQVAEMRLSIKVYQHRTRGERRYFHETLIETFLLLLRTDMWIKAGATDTALTQMAKLNLFLQHDMKNIAQFIQLMEDQLTHMPPDKEQKVLAYLRKAAPLIRHRADRVVRSLTMKQPPANALHTMHLRKDLEQLCHLYQLDCQITGEAEIEVPAESLDSALDNILKNYSDIALRNQIKPLVSIAIVDTADNIRITISAADTPLSSDIERLFEPFWSSDPAGMGIGLYQAKQLLEMCQGTLHAGLADDGQLHFTINFPRL